MSKVPHRKAISIGLLRSELEEEFHKDSRLALSSPIQKENGKTSSMMMIMLHILKKMKRMD